MAFKTSTGTVPKVSHTSAQLSWVLIYPPVGQMTRSQMITGCQWHSRAARDTQLNSGREDLEARLCRRTAAEQPADHRLLPCTFAVLLHSHLQEVEDGIAIVIEFSAGLNAWCWRSTRDWRSFQQFPDAVHAGARQQSVQVFKNNSASKLKKNLLEAKVQTNGMRDALVSAATHCMFKHFSCYITSRLSTSVNSNEHV